MSNQWLDKKLEEKIATLELALENVRAAFLQRTDEYNKLNLKLANVEADLFAEYDKKVADLKVYIVGEVDKYLDHLLKKENKIPSQIRATMTAEEIVAKCLGH
jgi:hypothetical protein